MVAEQTQKAVLGHVTAALGAVAVTVLMTWPLARHTSDHILAAIYHWDAYTNAMIMGGHVDAVLGRGPLSLYDNYFFAPLPNAIVFNENLFGLTLLFAPFYLISDNPLWAYNLTLLTSLSLSVFLTYLLARRLTGSGYASFVAGVAFAFSPYVMFELGRIQLVATQWIPACFLLLHRAIERRRLHDVLGLWLFYLLQVGTSLYYAMFMIPLLALSGAVLLARERPSPGLYLRIAAGGALAAAITLAMTHPYFTVREAFSLERSLAFASSYDGKLSFFANVHETNRTLTALHHRPRQNGAHEEIAFVGFTVWTLLGLALGIPLCQAARSRRPWDVAITVARWLATTVIAFVATLLFHSMLAGGIVLGLGIWLERHLAAPFPFSGYRGLYLAVLLLAIGMFLGLTPIEWRGAPVRGLYYYFHTYFPGFDGIRKVSRQAVLTTLSFCVLAGFGGAWLFSQLAGQKARALAFCALLTVTCFELRCFPHPLRSVWAEATVPEAYRFLASVPAQDLVAALPQDDGMRHFRGDHGLALHNYLMLYHKHRSVNGQSSWLPPVSELVDRALHHLPYDGARRILQSVGARHLVVHGAELLPRHRDLPEKLAARPEHYRRVFQRGSDSVFSLSTRDDPTLTLVETPTLPGNARLIPSNTLRARANAAHASAAKAIDGSPATFWMTPRHQSRGQTFELVLDGPRPVIAIEIANPWHLTDLPLSFEWSVASGASPWRAVFERPVLRVFREFVYSPKTFVFRVVLPSPALADRVRLTIRQPVPGRAFTIHEARLYEQAP